MLIVGWDVNFTVYYVETTKDNKNASSTAGQILTVKNIIDNDEVLKNDIIWFDLYPSELKWLVD